MSIEKLQCTDSRVESLKKLNAMADAIETKANPDLDNLSAAGQAKFDAKANKSTTLSGYGITNAYSKTEVDRLLDTKANESTTLAGYGITDAYTKTEAENRYVNVTGGEMTGNLTVNNGKITCNQTSNTQPIHINHSSSDGFVSIHNKANDMDFTATTAPSANQMAHRYLALDKNGQYINTIETAHLTNNNFQTLIATRRSVGGTAKTVNLAQVITSTGTTNTFISGSQLEVQNDTYNFVARSATMDITQTPTTNQYVGYEIRDKNNARCAYIGAANSTSGSKQLVVQLHGVNTLAISGMTTLGINGKNVPYVTEQVSGATNWYRIWSDGRIDQGGRVTITSGNANRTQTFNLIKNYTGDYVLTGLDFCGTEFGGDGSDGQYINAVRLYSKNNTSFTLKIGFGEGSYFNWYASGK